MSLKAGSLGFGCLLFRVAHAGLNDFVRFENDAGDAVKPKQPLLLADRDGRFLRFDTKDTEIELELGVAVPFLKIPLAARSGGHVESAHPPDHRVTVNPAGLLVGATILFSSFLLIPWVLPGGLSGHQNHQKRKVDESSYGDGGREGGSGLAHYVQNMLTSQINPSNCALKAMCLAAKHANSVMPSLFETMLRLNGVADVAESTGIGDAVRSGDCDSAFPSCMLTSQTMSLVPTMLSYLLPNK